ncbi:histidine kinase [Nocardia sp. NPDC051030]|uniref:sensor histidine kinase n=1 Tax=Nocardia sp. NPDC051030 TaxID=3155162 RepID=UPI003432AB0E
MNVISATPQELGQALRDLPELLTRSRDRLRLFVRHPVIQYQRSVEEMGFDYPVAVVLLIDVMMVVVSTTAVIQRYVLADYFPSPLPLVALILTYIIGPLCMIIGLAPRPLLFTLAAMAAGGLFLTQPVPVDMAPFILIAAAGEIAAITPTVASLPIAAAIMAELVFFESIGHLDMGLPWCTFGVAFGWMTGQLLNYQRRYLYQEREYQDVRAQTAADGERRRIAREVHDVIAHSLSITLLHVTAARHALQTDRDVDEAVEALTDAERLGRQAMADIRRTVGLLDQRPSPQAPEPGLDDIEDLVTDFVRAGMEVDFRMEGDTSMVTAGIGLALYRICQESLSNIAKHAPGASASLRITLCAKDINVLVSNTLPPGVSLRPGQGMGISGMRQRIGLLGGTLSAGLDAQDGWEVHARIPVSTPLSCIAVAAEDSLRTAFQSMHRKLHDDNIFKVSPAEPQESM